MRHARFAGFAVGVAAVFVVGIAVTEVASWWILFSLFAGIPAVAAGVFATAVTTWF